MRLQSKFTHSEADSCNAKKIFLAGDSLKTWSDSGEAAAIFWTQILMPLIRSNSRWDCEGFAQDMPGSIARDSLWLRQKMARVHGPKEEIAPPNAAHGAPSGSSQSQWSCIVKETHIAARLKNPGQSEWKRDILARLPGVPSNYGPHRGAGQQFSKRDVFELAIERFPYLCKKTEGQRRNNAPQHRYCLRPLGLPIYEKVMSEVCASNDRTVTEVFGTWEDWGPDWDKTTARGHYEEESHERELWEHGFFIVDEVVDIQSLSRYSDLRVDRRQQDLTEYIALHKTRGWLDEKGLSHVEQRYRKKLIAGRPLGRMYGDRLSIQSITKEARSAACRSFAVDVDFEHAHSSILCNIMQELDMKNVRNFSAWHRL